MTKGKSEFDLEDRLIDFAVRIIRTSESLPKSKVGKHIAGQLIRIRADLIKPASKLEALIDESDQLISIFVKSVSTAMQNLKKTS